ncbi:MAG TPA: T9SS type A sorting domain-containing protein, partial [Candidatus Latescibacteria bacterium]|nr:T9SS type A sorting domain-containing protein [Candidatus Latescibacterota bacterium]
SRLRISAGSEGGEPLSGLVVYPNPFVTGEADELTFSGLPLGASLKIYGLDGQLVAQVPGVPGRATLSWRGQNEAGFIVGSGIYYFVADDSGGKRITGKVAVVNGSR